MKKFDQELGVLHQQIVDMGQLTESMLNLVVDALCGKRSLRETEPEIRGYEERLDELQVATDGHAVNMLTVFGPVASDLRHVLTISHVASQLERMGDQVMNICEALELLPADNRLGIITPLKRMATMVAEMVRDSISAYVSREVRLAETTIARDDLVDSFNDQISQELLSDEVLRQVLEGPKDLADAVGQILIARSLERIGDHATNICEELIYLIKGDDVRHKMVSRTRGRSRSQAEPNSGRNEGS